MPHRATRLTPRLARVVAVLRDGRWWNRLSLSNRAWQCDVRDCVHELRALGYPIEGRWDVCEHYCRYDALTDKHVVASNRLRSYRLDVVETRRLGLPLAIAKL